MTITREQVADLREGDVVELCDPSFPEAVLRGPVRVAGDDLMVSTFAILRQFGGVPFSAPWDLTVVSRAPRPLYVNHPRTEPVMGDVVRDGDAADGRTWCADEDAHLCWERLDDGGHNFYHRNELPARLRLLVDGETGQVVP